MSAAVAALLLALWLLGGHLQDNLLGRAVRLWMGPFVALALVADGLGVTAVAAVGLALLSAVAVSCLSRGSARLPTDVTQLLDLAERETRSRYVRDLRSASMPPTTHDQEREAHG